MLLIPTTAMANDFVEESDQQVKLTPRWSIIVDAMTDLKISGNVATVDCWVNGDVLSATKAKAIVELQLKSGNSWIAYATWVDTQNDYEAAVYETKSVTTGNTYRVKATYTVWEGAQSEEVMVFTDEVTA